MRDRPILKVLTPEEILLVAKNFNTSLVHQVESTLIGEIEKMEGKVPLPYEINQYGTCRINEATGVQQYFWRGMLLVTVTPGEVNGEGQRGVLIEIVRQPEKPA